MAFIKLTDVTIDIPVLDAHRSFRSGIASKFTGGKIQHNQKKVVVRALYRMNLNVAPGDRVGIIGHNGAGKSTLLRVAAGIYQPTGGIVERQGRVTTLFNPSVGMDMDDTGYHNIINIAAFIGVSRRQIRSKIDDIVEFCELGEFIDLPVRIYSSGMMVRLGFAVATATEPELLIMDEGIGAGDARFADKAQARLDKFFARTNTMLFASHSTDQIRKLCNRAIILEHGSLIFEGDVETAINEYERRRLSDG